MSIQVKNITHIYDEGLPNESVALEDVSFELEDNSFVGIIGHTGSGKSTLVSHLNGLVKPRSGKIIVGGMDITAPDADMRVVRKKVGLVFQYPEYQLFEETVARDVAFGPKNIGLDDADIALRVRDVLDCVGLDPDIYGERSPFDLSGGQKRRVAIAGVLAMKPEVLVLDEPTAGLDPKAHKEVMDMICQVHGYEKNITVLVSHNMNDIAELCDKVLVLDKGRIIMDGTPDEVFARADELERIGLDVPEITKITNGMRKAGLDVSEGILDMDRAVREITAALKGGSR